MNKLDCDVLIFGGGIAGLWLLDELCRRSIQTVLVETRALGAGQTIASQGILHGGLKYSLGGLVDGSSKAVADMPRRWRSSLAGSEPPDLRGVRILSPCCHMWRTDSFASRAGLTAAKVVVRTPVERTDAASRPAALADCPGEVLRVDEQVLDVRSLMETFRTAHWSRLLSIEPVGIAMESRDPGSIGVRVRPLGMADDVHFSARCAILSAGEGNAELRRIAGLDPETMQRRPLHMVMGRGKLPSLFGHCIDGNKTRVTITSNLDAQGRIIWLVGGEIAEQGVHRDAPGLVRFAREELRRVLPGVDFENTQWATYRINRAEGRVSGNRRPEGVVWRREGAVITAWPTKLVLAPQLAREIADSLTFASGESTLLLPEQWPRPDVAPPPWEVDQLWIS